MKYLIYSLFFLSVNFSMAQNVEVVTLDKLNALTGNKDSIYILNFWATWCKPCIEEMPEIEKVREFYSTKEVSVFLINIEDISELEKRVVPFAQKRNLKSRLFLLDEPDPNEWIPKISEKWTGSIPATVIKTKKSEHLFERKITFDELKTLIDAELKN